MYNKYMLTQYFGNFIWANREFWAKHEQWSRYLFKHIFIEFNYKVKNLYFIKKSLYKINIKFDSSTHILGVYGQ